MKKYFKEINEKYIINRNALVSLKVKDLFSIKKVSKVVFYIIKEFPFFIIRKYKNINLRKENILFYEKNKQNIEDLINILEDNISEEVVMGLINFRKTYNFKFIRNIFKPLRRTHVENNTITDSDHYFSTDIINLSNKEGFVNCGGYDGDTVKSFLLQTKNKFKKIFVFEPSEANFNQLVKNINNLNLPKDSIFCYQKGVFSENKECRFTASQSISGGGQISNEGNEIIEVVSLDIFLSQEDKDLITYINMDIEGVEIQALIGMQEIIKKNKPKLAISVYHEPGHLWEIPFLIKKLNPEYKIYLRQESLSEAETVCYAI